MMRTNAAAWLISVAGVLGQSSAASGQMTPVTPQTPREAEPTTPSGVEAADPQAGSPTEQLAKPSVSDRFMPTPPDEIDAAVPQIQALTIPRPGGKAAPEGSFLSRRLGVVHLIETGDLIFAPAIAPTEEGERQASPVFLVSPSMESARLRNQISQQSFTWTGRVSGEVFLYRGRNILIISAFAADSMQARPGPAGDAQPGRQLDGQPGERPGEQPGDRADAQADPQAVPPTDSLLDPRVSALEAELLSERTAPRALDRAMDDPRNDSLQAPAAVPPTGSLVTRRRARLVRDPIGRWQVRFDQDGATREPPLTVVPCRLLELMQREASRRGEAWTFHVSGRVIASPEGGFIIPTLFMTERDDDLRPRQ